MRSVFADTFYYLALLSVEDAWHGRAEKLAESLEAPTVTTAWVLTEVADAFSDAPQRGSFLRLLKALREDPDCWIVPASQELFELGVELFAQRPDKDWSLTDCISFVLMRQQGISEALTADRHFEQAGFTIFLK